MYDPWDDFERHRLEGWKIRWRRLTGRLGRTNFHDRSVDLDPDQDQPQERGTVTHEVVHIERGPIPDGWEEWEERIVNRLAARRLISLDELVDGMLWSYDVEELAVVLWVDVPTVRVRLQTLTEAEGREIQARLDEAEARFPEDVYDGVAWSVEGLAWNGDMEQGEEVH